MLLIVNYVFAFFTVTVAGCLQPVNWESCSKINEWLIPDLVFAWKLKTGEIVPYQTEKDYLNKNKNVNERFDSVESSSQRISGK